jgi:hypothetical protein
VANWKAGALVAFGVDDGVEEVEDADADDDGTEEADCRGLNAKLADDDDDDDDDELELGAAAEEVDETARGLRAFVDQALPILSFCCCGRSLSLALFSAAGGRSPYSEFISRLEIDVSQLNEWIQGEISHTGNTDSKNCFSTKFHDDPNNSPLLLSPLERA